MSVSFLELFKCHVCDTVVEVLAPAGLELVCCGRVMQGLRPRGSTSQHGMHAISLEPCEGGIFAKVAGGSHPATASHRIEWIELIADGRSYRQFLQPGDPSEAFFEVDAHIMVARAYCSKHGLWKAPQRSSVEAGEMEVDSSEDCVAAC